MANIRGVFLYKVSLLISLSAMVVEFIFYIQHFSGVNTIFLISQIIGLPYIIIGLVDVYKFANISIIEKILWTIGFIGLSWIVGLSYYLIELKPKCAIK